MSEDNPQLIYYAHSKLIYGTKQEKDELRFIEKRYPFDKVVCPNRDIGEKGWMQPYLDAVLDCDMLVCSEYDGHIGKGVFSEVETALNHNHPVFVLSNKKLTKVIGVQIVDRTDWKVRYGMLVVASKKEK